MQRSFQDLFPNLKVTPIRAAAFGAFVGAMAALAACRLLGDAFIGAIAPMPAYLAVLIAISAGAAISWAKTRNR
jgi:hypothetical protein